MARTKEKQESYSDQVHARAAASSRTATVTSGTKPWTRDSIISAVLGGANLALAINQIARPVRWLDDSGGRTGAVLLLRVVGEGVLRRLYGTHAE